MRDNVWGPTMHSHLATELRMRFNAINFDLLNWLDWPEYIHRNCDGIVIAHNNKRTFFNKKEKSPIGKRTRGLSICLLVRLISIYDVRRLMDRPTTLAHHYKTHWNAENKFYPIDSFDYASYKLDRTLSTKQLNKCINQRMRFNRDSQSSCNGSPDDRPKIHKHTYTYTYIWGTQWNAENKLALRISLPRRFLGS